MVLPPERTGMVLACTAEPSPPGNWAVRWLAKAEAWAKAPSSPWNCLFNPKLISPMNTTHPENRRILVIDDYRAIHDDFRKILVETHLSSLAAAEAQLFGQAVPVPFQIDSAYQGQEALGLVEKALAE